MTVATNRIPSFSIIVVSWQRPDWLRRCLAAIRQLDHPMFEVIIVADTPSLNQVDSDGCKTLAFDQPNISLARNAGIGLAAGEYCAFIDDDSVPEPLWLHHHETTLSKTGAAASVGFVRGRNGISFQSSVHSVDHEAETHIEPETNDTSFIPKLSPTRALKLIGTNMVIQRQVLLDIGGFDPACSFFLDDSDISLRLSQSGHKLAVAALAEVHHAFAPSPRRTRRRAPTDLFEIGKSSAVFLRRHNAKNMEEIFDRIQRRERNRLMTHMVNGTIEPRDVAIRLATLLKGWELGKAVELQSIEPLAPKKTKFLQMPSIGGDHLVFWSRLFNRRRTIAQAELAMQTQRVSVFSFSLTPIRHHMRYVLPGIWLQTGGQFGRSDRDGSLFIWCRFANRLRSELSRVAKQRGLRID